MAAKICEKGKKVSARQNINSSDDEINIDFNHNSKKSKIEDKEEDTPSAILPLLQKIDESRSSLDITEFDHLKSFFAKDSNETLSKKSIDDKKSFSDFDISRPILKALTAMNILYPTKIQQECIDLGLAGENICASALTGSGKTAAYLIPIIERLFHKPKNSSKVSRVLILVPTRELASQVFNVAKSLIKFCPNISACSIYGGSSNISSQNEALKSSPDIIVSTPGRLLEILSDSLGKKNYIDSIEILVLDEADRMVDEAFIDQIMEIMKKCPISRQNMLFTATANENIYKLMEKCEKLFKKINLSSNNEVSENLTQFFIKIKTDNLIERTNSLIYSLLQIQPKSCLIFFKLKKNAHFYFALLRFLGFSVGEFHGDMSQQYRIKTLEDFRDGKIKILACTDVASRGLDIDSVDLVLNFDMPSDHTVYVHRVGRTARAGKLGRALSFVSEKERKAMKKVIKKSNFELQRFQVDREKMEKIIKIMPDIADHVKKVLDTD